MAFALPQNGQVVGGAATISQTGSELDIVQSSNRAVIDWQSFSIGKTETTRFIQPGATSIAVNRVTGVDPSQILGKLTANGQVVLVNPNGVLFGKGAEVNVGGLVASTAGIKTDNAMAGTMVFDQPGTANATIENDGRITARSGGLVALVAPNVVNNGLIQAKLGKVALASGDKWTLDLYGDRLVSFDVTDKVRGSVGNSGTIKAGTVEITANAAKDIVGNAIDMSGVIEATTVHREGGTIVLDGGEGNVSVSGALLAAGSTGGSVAVTGKNVTLTGALVDASGTTGGGAIEIGGGPRGSGSLAHASNVTIDASSILEASAWANGNGGSISVWSDGTTQFHGSLFATGGAQSGNGGFAETSGHDELVADGYVDLTAAHGQMGSYLLDPTNISIYGNVTPAFVSSAGITDGTQVSLSSSLQLWLDAADASSITLSYNTLSTTASGTSGSNTITVGNNAGLAIGERIQIGTSSTQLASVDDTANIYTITAINGTAITLDATLTATATGATLYGGFVSQITDKSGLGNNATQTNTGSQPLWLANGQNGLGVINFNGAGNYLTLPNLDSSNLATFVSFEQAVAFGSGFATIYGANASNGFGVGINPGSYVQDFTKTAVSDAHGNHTLTFPGTYLIQQNFDGTTAQFYLNGASDGSSSYSTSINSSGAGYAIGGLPNLGGYYNQFNMNDILLYNIASGFAGTNSQALINQYQSTKWAIALTGPGVIGGETGLTGSEAQQAMASIQAGATTDGYSVFSTNYLTHLSQTSNVILQASNNINIDLQGDTLSLASGRNLTLTAGTITSASNGTIQTAGTGAISLIANNGDINLGNAVTLNATGSGSVSLKATGNIIETGGGITTQGGAITLAANSADSNSGAIALTNSSLASNGGNIKLGGGSGAITGVALNTNGSVQTAASGYAYGNNTYANGVLVSGGTVNAGTGSIIANGIAASTSTDNAGGINNSGTIQAAGAISLVGTGGSSSSGNSDVGIYNTGVIDNTGSGTVTLLGTGSGSTHDDPDGIIQYGTIQGVNGDLIVHGLAISTSGGFGIRSYSTAKTTGSGNVYLIGNANIYGYGLLGLGSTAQTDTGSITIDSVGAPFYTLSLSLTSVSGNITIKADSVPFDGSISTGGTVNLFPDTISTAINVATGSSGLQITSTMLDHITAGSLTIGNSSDTGAITLGSYGNWTAPTTVVTGNSGTINIVGIEGATGSGSFTFTGPTNLGGSITTANQLVSFNSPVTVSADSTINAGSGTVTFGNTVNGAHNLTASAGMFNLTGALGGTTPLAAVSLTSTNALTLPSINAASIFAETTAATADLSIGATDTLTTSGAITLVAGRNFTNDGPSNALSAGGRWLIYSDSSAADTFNGLTAGFHRYSCTYGGACPSIPNTGNGFLYQYTPVLTVTPNVASITYGSAANLSGYAYLLNGYLGSDSSADTVTGTVNGTTPYTQGNDANTYAITYGNGSLTSALGYGFTYAAGTLTVTKAHVTIAPTGSQTYGGTNVAVSYAYNGLVNSDPASIISGVGFSTTATNSSSAGAYSITAIGGTATNYIVSDATGVYTVNKAPLTIAPTGSQLYGGANATISYLYSGLVNGDASSVVSGLGYAGITSGSNVGNYILTATGGSAANYTVFDSSGVYTVAPASLTITANNASRLSSQPDPAFSASYSGLVNGDSPAVVTGLSFIANDQPLSPAGLYQITPYGAAAANYSISYVSGALTIIKDSVAPAPSGNTVLLDLENKTGLASSLLAQVINNQIFTAKYSSTGGSTLFSQNLAQIVVQNYGPSDYGSHGSSDQTDQVVCLKSDSSTNGCAGAIILRDF